MAILELEVKDPVSAELKSIAQRFPAACDVALGRVGKIVQNAAIRQVDRISNRPIPTRAQVNAYNRKGGKKPKPKRVGGKGEKAWSRDGGLLRAVQGGYSAQAGQVTLKADVPYALARHDLGTEAWIPKRPALGVIRKNPFFTEALEITEPQIIPAFENALQNELKLG